MCLGRHVNEVVGGPPIDIPTDELCSRNLENESFVGFEFSREGYKTMFAEDWINGALTWPPNCEGFMHAPTDHYMRCAKGRNDGLHTYLTL